MSVAASHVICDRIEDQLKKTIKGIVPTIHVEPDPKSKAGGLKVT